MDSLQVSQFVVICIDTQAEEETGITSVYYLVIPELHNDNLAQVVEHVDRSCGTDLDKVGLIFLVSRSD